MPGLPGLKSAREKAGLTQAQLGEKVGLTDAAITRYENGGREPDMDRLRRIAEILGVTVDALLADPQPTQQPLIECPECHGTGKVHEEHDYCTETLGCHCCEGTGKVPQVQA